MSIETITDCALCGRSFKQEGEEDSCQRVTLQNKVVICIVCAETMIPWEWMKRVGQREKRVGRKYVLDQLTVADFLRVHAGGADPHDLTMEDLFSQYASVVERVYWDGPRRVHFPLPRRFDRAVTELMSKESGLPTLELTVEEVEREAFLTLPVNLLHEFEVLPVRFVASGGSRKCVLLAIANIFRLEEIKENIESVLQKKGFSVSYACVPSSMMIEITLQAEAKFLSA